jgi:hypothetical protein
VAGLGAKALGSMAKKAARGVMVDTKVLVVAR